MTEGARGRSPFPPIASYGFLPDCETTTLIAPSGNVEWLCLPRPGDGYGDVIRAEGRQDTRHFAPPRPLTT